MAKAKEPKLPMMPVWPREELSATRHMTLAERGTYFDLKLYNWELGELPNDPTRLSRMLGVSVDEFKTVWPAMRNKFVRTPDGLGLVNEQLEIERRKSFDFRAKAHARAKSGGKSTRERWEKDPDAMKAKSQAPSPPKRRLQAVPKPRLIEGPPAQAQSLSTSESGSGERVSEGAPEENRHPV
ncbi:MAG: YdaU family protein [Pseudomonadota bacterium]|nr:YdaU family protein [Pseudomonadota bacterium]